MPIIDPDHDTDPDDWKDAAAEHFTGDWWEPAQRRKPSSTKRRPFSRSTINTTTEGTTTS